MANKEPSFYSVLIHKLEEDGPGFILGVCVLLVAVTIPLFFAAICGESWIQLAVGDRHAHIAYDRGYCEGFCAARGQLGELDDDTCICAEQTKVKTDVE